MNDKKDEKERKEFADLLDSLAEKTNYYGQIDEGLFRFLNMKISEVVYDAIIEHEKEYHAVDRAKKGFN